jgi:hypothetical protein
MEINSGSGAQNLSSNDFLRQRQIARDQYFHPEKYETPNSSASGAVSENTAQEASSLNSGEDTYVASAPEGSAANAETTGSATAQNTATSNNTAQQPQDNLSPLQRQYGSFYTTSPNGESLAELRARSDEIIARAQQREQSAIKSANAGEELGGAAG